MLTHRYGDHVHLFDDRFLLSLLARIGSPEIGPDQLPSLVRTAYRRLLQEVLAREFPVRQVRAQTRMTAVEPKAVYDGPVLCRETRLVLCAVIRAGILPAQACFEAAGEVLAPDHVRLDFLNMSRVTDDEHRVTGVRLDGSKIGGSVDDALVIVPDPMGATGGTVCRAYEVYRELGESPRAFVALHLMITPEAIRRITAMHPEIRIYAARLDRGLSSERALKSEPGTFPDEERGLNDVDYIVPGAGGMGELLTNSWV
ncbi:MAG: uracil phosphoribosyltransferase [Planctomycetes bacterium]|nr:uracil phosphoribosyltransferase [Planctomycetota bacterium]